ncbi:hypothetical protein MMPV_007650 [Pyropia vietnamensis]
MDATAATTPPTAAVQSPVTVESLNAAAAAAAAGAAAAASSSSLSPVARQERTPAGEPCTDDDDCGGYAVTPYRWCRVGFGSDVKTCREYVEVGAKCDTTALVCPRNQWNPSPDADETIECRSGTCRRKQPASGLGTPCLPFIWCEDGLSCEFLPSLESTFCVASYQGLGESCDGPFQKCLSNLKCATPAGDCTNTTCPGDGPATCQEVEEGDACGPGTTVEWCPSGMDCDAGTCQRFVSSEVGDACGTNLASCNNNLPCVTSNGTLCPFNRCPGDEAGTCRLPQVGDVCSTQNLCWAGNSGLTCAPVEVIIGGGRTNVRSVCISPKAAGAACSLSGVDGVCGTDTNGDWQLCIGGTCSASPNGAVVGDQCDRMACSDGSACVYNPALTGLPVAVCANATRGAGDSCTPPGTPGTEYCDPGALLTCTDGTCVAPDSVPTEGEACDPTKRMPCADTQEADGSRLICRWIDPQIGSQCRFQRFEGGACNDVQDCLGGFRFQCVDGICTEFADPPSLAFNASCTFERWSSSMPACADGLACRAPDSRPRWETVCVNNVTIGAACDFEYNQCASGLCQDGVCTAKVAPGGACKTDYECSTDHYCWRGEGATGQTCRKWVGFNERCDNTASKCWRQLTCDEGLCKNPTSDNVAGAVCETDDDCPGEQFVCRIENGFSTLRVCKRLVAPDEQCSGRFDICPPEFECTYRGFMDERCIKWVPRNAACEGPGIRCWTDLRCSAEGVCVNALQRPGNRGGQCDDDSECGDGLTCVPQANSGISRCQQVAAPTESCESRDGNLVCPDGFSCIWRRGQGSVCLKFVPPGGDCSGGEGVLCWNGSTCETADDGSQTCSAVL